MIHFPDINFYGLTLAISILVCFYIFQKITTKKKGLDFNQLTDLFFYVFLGAILFGRLFFVFSFWGFFSHDPLEIFKIWHGGIAFYGVFSGGLLGLLFWTHRFTRKTNQNFQKYFISILDSILTVLPLGQSIGRWGNFFNEEIFGPPTTLPWGIFISPERRPEAFLNETHFHPVFLYESILTFCLFLLLMKIRHHPKPGLVTSLFLVIHGFIRFSLEFLRTDPQAVFWHLRQYQWLALLEIILGIFLFWYFQSKNVKIKSTNIKTNYEKK